jgi:hypothetical protein
MKLKIFPTGHWFLGYTATFWYNGDWDGKVVINVNKLRILSCHSSGVWMLASHCRDLGSIPGDFKWDSWWMKWHWSRFSPSSSVFLCESSFHHCSILICHRPTEVCNSPDQAAVHYHTLSPKAGASAVTQHVDSLGGKVVFFRMITWKEMVMVYSGYCYPSFCLEGLRKTTETYEDS